MLVLVAVHAAQNLTKSKTPETGFARDKAKLV